ncbi:MAG: site-2 protease family protein [Clostridia bacterium]|nr:site-2 protease family protein [Clostridia bacterium]
MNVVFILLAILMFGFLIFIHEFGHFSAARAFGVTVREFAIGMGPKLVSRVSKKTGIRYSVRALPFGGYVSMAGEDEESDDPGALCAKPVWQRMIITAAGAAMNLCIGFLVMGLLVSLSPSLGGTVVADFFDGATSPGYGLQVEDRIVMIGDTRVHTATDLVYTIMHDARGPVDVTVVRGGEKVVLTGVQFPSYTEAGHVYGNRDFYVYAVEKTPYVVLHQAFWQSVNTVQMIWDSLYDLVFGEYTVEDLSGPIGVTQAIGQAAGQGAQNFGFMFVFISVNLGIFNLLPLPALDGGRLFFQLVELILRRPISRSVEGYIHFAGILLLMLLMVFVTFQDLTRLFGA